MYCIPAANLKRIIQSTVSNEKKRSKTGGAKQRHAKPQTAKPSIEELFVRRKPLPGEPAPQLSEELFGKVFQTSPAAISISTIRDGCYLEVNDSLLRMLGYGREEVIGRTAAELSVWKHLGDRDRLIHTLDAEGTVRGAHFQLRRKDGAIRDVLVSAERICVRGGAYMLAITQDITETKQSAQALAESEARKRAILESSLDAVITFDEAGCIQELNPAAEKMLRYPVCGGAPQRWFDFVASPPAAHANLADKANPALGIYGHLLGKRVEMTARRSDGTEFPAEITISRINLEGKEGFTLWMRDLTERRVLENQLWHAQKMEAVGRLAGGVAHDFNNLVTVISGYSDLLLMSLAKENPLRRHVEEVKKAGDRAASLTRQLLAFSRRQVLDPQVLDLNAVISNVDRMLRRLIGEDIDLLSVLHPGVWPVKADPGQIEQVLVNLAVNARDAMPSGGKLTLETANVTLGQIQGMRYEPPMPPGHYVMLAVSDTGIGMNSETQSHVFEPFFTTKEEGKGTGLGLATVYGIVKQSGGYIWIYSETEHGTTFKVYLPRAQEVLAEAFIPGMEASPRGGTETILVAEDEIAVRSLVCSVLESGGYTVLEGESGDAALLIARAHDGHIDLLLTDVVMPRMSGRELADRVQMLDPGIRVVYMSGYTEKAIVHHGMLDADAVLLQKPFSPDDLVRKVREVLDAPEPVLLPLAQG